MGQEIAQNYHETWNGSGYPYGLSKTQIPISARITIIVDQYDALRSSRPYKRAYSHQEAFDVITKGDDKTSPEHFDPEILDVFIEINNEFRDIFETFE